MSRLYAENILKFQELDVEIGDGITLVVGPNSAGKSCLAAILAALTAHNSNPLHFSGAASTLYVRDGAGEGMAELDGVQFRPGAGISTPTGQEPTASIESAGLVDFVAKAQTPSARAKVWKSLFLPDSPRELLEPVWTLGKRQLEKTLEIIEDRGWENAEKIYIDQRRAAKQKWKGITGQDFGAKKAASWKPEGFQPELEGASESDLIDALSHARAAREGATVVQAIAESDIEKARVVRDDVIPGLQGKLEKAKEGRLDAGKLQQTAEAAHKTALENKQTSEARIDRASRALEAEAPLECPTCKSGLAMQQGVLSKWRELTPEQQTQAKAAIQEEVERTEKLDTAISDAASNRNEALKIYKTAQREVFEVEAELNTARSAARFADRTPQQGAHEGTLAALERAVEVSRRDLEAWRANRDAQEQVESVTQLEVVLGLLGPGGPRSQGIRQGITNINAVLKRVEALSGWKPITLSPDYQLFSGGRQIQAVAKNEKLKAQWSLQVACAMLSGNQWVILDELDTLRESAWDGLVDVINAISKGMPELRIVLCGTRGIDEPDGWAVVELA